MHSTKIHDVPVHVRSASERIDRSPKLLSSLRGRSFCSRSAFTLIEVLIATFILSIAVLSSLMFFSNAMNAAQYSRDLTLATLHAEHTVEGMYARDSLSNIIESNWEQWAVDESLTVLPSESVEVVFTNEESDPLEITVRVSWTRIRDYNVELTTRMTK